MLWFLLALTGYLAMAGVFVLDKLILTKTLDKPVVYTFYSTIFLFGALLAWPFGVELLAAEDWIWALVSGLTFGFGMWAMFIAVKHGEASHINPMIGGIITIATFGIASVYLGETLTLWQMIGMGVLVFATFLLSLESSGAKAVIHRGAGWALVSGLLFAISHTSAKYIYELYPFLTGFVWTRATTGFVGLVALLFPAVWMTFRRRPTRGRTVGQCVDCGFAQTHAVGIVVGTKALGVIGVVLIQLAIAVGSVTLVNALVGVQYALMFLMIYLLTRFAPAFFKEEFTRRELAIETVAIVLVVLGSALFVV